MFLKKEAHMDRQLPIQDIFAREFWTPGAIPRWMAEVLAGEENVGRAAVPSGVFTGKYEARELRDQEKDTAALA